MMGSGRLVINKKTVLIVIGILVVLLVGGAFALFYQGPSQNIPDSSEPMLDFAAPGSKIAGIQALVKTAGLTHEQYTKVYQKLNTELPAQEANSSFFLFVEGSLTSSPIEMESIEMEPDIQFVTEHDEETAEVSPEFAKYANEEEPINGSEEESGLNGTIYFTMRSESNTEYAIEVYTGGDLTTAEVKIERK